MKNLFKVSLLAVAVVSTISCSGKNNEVTPTKVEFQNNQEKIAYAIGSSLAGYANSHFDKPNEFGMGLNKEMVIEGFTDRLHNKSLMTEKQAFAMLKLYDDQVNAAAENVQTTKVQEIAKAAKVEKSFLVENAKVKGVNVTASGLQYSVITKTDGPKPTVKDTVTVHYVGTLIDGTEFDSSVKRGQPATFPLELVIPGWIEGLQLMSVGEKYKFVIPSALAYGGQGAGSIPPGATLLFDVELLSIKAAK